MRQAPCSTGRPTVSMTPPSPTTQRGQACKDSTCHWPVVRPAVRVADAARRLKRRVADRVVDERKLGDDDERAQRGRAERFVLERVPARGDNDAPRRCSHAPAARPSPLLRVTVARPRARERSFARTTARARSAARGARRTRRRPGATTPRAGCGAGRGRKRLDRKTTTTRRIRSGVLHTTTEVTVDDDIAPSPRVEDETRAERAVRPLVEVPLAVPLGRRAAERGLTAH